MLRILSKRFFSSDSVLLTRPTAHTALLTLNRPKQLNALNSTVISDLICVLKQLDADASTRAVVLTGNLKAFAAGADIKEMEALTASEVVSGNFLSEFASIKSRKPLIAAVEGFALGGGCELAMACDMIVASETAVFGQPEILLATIPGAGGTQRLTHAAGKYRAMELILTGRKFPASEAKELGLVSRLVPQGQAVAEALKLAQEIGNFSAPVVALAKAAVLKALELPLAEGLESERSLFHATFALNDRKEGMNAFVNKRSPNWTHQ